MSARGYNILDQEQTSCEWGNEMRLTTISLDPDAKEPPSFYLPYATIQGKKSPTLKKRVR